VLSRYAAQRTLSAVSQRDELFTGQWWCRQIFVHPANMRLRLAGSSRIRLEPRGTLGERTDWSTQGDQNVMAIKKHGLINSDRSSASRTRPVRASAVGHQHQPRRIDPRRRLVRVLPNLMNRRPRRALRLLRSPSFVAALTFKHVKRSSARWTQHARNKLGSVAAF
jgi:hypothetical protein